MHCSESTHSKTTFRVENGYGPLLGKQRSVVFPDDLILCQKWSMPSRLFAQRDETVLMDKEYLMPQPWNMSVSVKMLPEWVPPGEPNPDAWKSMSSVATGERWKTGDTEWRPYRPYRKSVFRYTQEPTKILGGTFRGYPPAFAGQNPFTGNAGWTDIIKPMWWVDTQNRSYAELIDRLRGETPQLLTLMAEWSESLAMIAARITWVRKTYKELRKGNFRGFIKRLGVAPKKAHVKYMNRKEYYRSGRRASAVAKNASSLWLEYWFGWAPTVSDLYNTVQTLCRELPAIEVYGRAFTRVNGTSVVTGASQRRSVTERGTFCIVQQVQTTIENPNLFLAQSLGLVNVPATMWEILPFSFVVDWFFKLGNVIESFSDFVGLKVLRSRHTAIAKVQNTWATSSHPPYVKQTIYHNSFVKMRRNVDNKGDGALQRPAIIWPFRLSAVYGPLNRARTASALLTQLFADRVLSGRRGA